MIEQEQFENICQESIHCTNLLCQQQHYRKYQGVCIKYIIILQNFQGDDEDAPRKCDSNECKLYHLDESKLNDKIQLGTINGFYCFNFCQTQCNEENCKFAHKEWIKEYCIKNFIFGCKNKQQCKVAHKNWADLKESIKNNYQIHNYYPEKFCKNRLSPQFLKDYCINYVFGECPLLKQKCEKKFHTDWENIFLLFSQFQIIQPCTQRGIYKESLFGFQKQQLSMARLICEEKQFQNFKADLGQSNIIDIVFVMDITGSMRVWQQQMINNIESIIAQFKKDIANQIVRVGFIGYRDNCDQQQDQMKYFNLTSNIQDLMNFIKRLTTKGGGDEAEDIILGLKQVLNLNLSRNQESMLCIFLIADSPCHGRQYHDWNFKGADDQIDNVIGTPLEDTMEAIKNLKRKNFFFCIKITEYTEKMFKIMQGVMKDMLVITPKTKPEELAGTVLFSLQQSFTQSQIQKKLNNKIWLHGSFQKPKIQKYDISSKIIDKQKFWNEFQTNLNKYCRSGETCLEIDTEKQQEIQSKKIRIFNAFDAINNQYIVIKISENYLRLYEQDGQVDQKLLLKQKKKLKQDIFHQVMLVRQLEFTERIQKIIKIKKIFLQYFMQFLFYINQKNLSKGQKQFMVNHQYQINLKNLPQMKKYQKHNFIIILFLVICLIQKVMDYLQQQIYRVLIQYLVILQYKLVIKNNKNINHYLINHLYYQEMQLIQEKKELNFLQRIIKIAVIYAKVYNYDLSINKLSNMTKINIILRILRYFKQSVMNVINLQIFHMNLITNNPKKLYVIIVQKKKMINQRHLAIAVDFYFLILQIFHLEYNQFQGFVWIVKGKIVIILNLNVSIVEINVKSLKLKLRQLKNKKYLYAKFLVSIWNLSNVKSVTNNMIIKKLFLKKITKIQIHSTVVEVKVNEIIQHKHIIQLFYQQIQHSQRMSEISTSDQEDYECSDGAIHQGIIINGKREGLGKSVWPNGMQYHGEWLNDKQHGKGKLVQPNGDWYDGEFQNGMANGFGKYFCQNGASYEGYWLNDLQHGYGKEVWPDTSNYEGQYQQGKKHGNGQLTFQDKSCYQGEFFQNEICGYGKLTWDDKYYEGQWKDQRMNGKGKTIWNDGRYYEGEYSNDKKHGFGIFVWTDGKKFEGNWENGKRHGFGKYIDKQGKLFEGLWKDDKPEFDIV